MKFLSFLVLSFIALRQISGYPQKDIQGTSMESQKVAPTQHKNNYDSDMLMEETEQTTGEYQGETEVEPSKDSQTFYPSFSPFGNQPLGHSRPLYYQPDAAYSHRPSAYQQHLGFDSNARFSGYKSDGYEERSSDANNILGSGNFGVIKGGTFYAENDADDQYAYGAAGHYDNYYSNGHGRPSVYFGSSHKRPQQQFENFRDFADINTPSYSEFVVVYANKNGTHHEVKKITQPKNILEHLAMLDEEVRRQDVQPEIPSKKLSKSKRKLALRLPEKKSNVKPKPVHRELYEPLLALS